MGWTEAQLVDYISRAEVSHSSYPSEKKCGSFFKDVQAFFIEIAMIIKFNMQLHKI